MKTPKTQGFYYYADGFSHWVYGMSAAEKRYNIKMHGAIIKFVHTN